MLITLLVLAVLAFMAFGLFGTLWLFGLAKAEKRNIANADTTLDHAFDGRQDVTFRITLTSIPFETAVAGAKARGYHLTHQSGADQFGTQTLLFEREDS